MLCLTFFHCAVRTRGKRWAGMTAVQKPYLVHGIKEWAASDSMLSKEELFHLRDLIMSCVSLESEHLVNPRRLENVSCLSNARPWQQATAERPALLAISVTPKPTVRRRYVLTSSNMSFYDLKEVLEHGSPLSLIYFRSELWTFW